MQHIPTVNLSVTSISGTYVAPGGILLDTTIHVPDITTQRGLSDRNGYGTLTTPLIRDNMSKKLLQAGVGSKGRIFYDD